MPAGKKSNRQVLQRSPREHRYEKLFVIVAEGEKTELQYFRILNGLQSKSQAKIFKGSHSSPEYVLKRMKGVLQQMENQLEEEPEPPYEAWLVMDKNTWPEKQLNELQAWAEENEQYGFALSNPGFEYWLLLHFEDGAGITSQRDCARRLKQHLPNYDKGINSRLITRERILKAIERAKKRDQPPCPDWPRNPGVTTVYRLVEKMLQE